MFCLGIFSLLSVLDLIFSQVELSDALSFAIDKDLPLGQNKKKLFTQVLINIQIYQTKSFCHEKIF